MAREVKSESITIRIPTALRSALEARAKSERRTLADVVRLILEDGLKAKRRARR